jgi:hypothetical protein
LGPQALEFLELVSAQQFVVVPSDQLFRAIPQELEGRTINTKKTAILVDQGDQVERVFDQGGIFCGEPIQAGRVGHVVQGSLVDAGSATADGKVIIR